MEDGGGEKGVEVGVWTVASQGWRWRLGAPRRAGERGRAAGIFLLFAEWRRAEIRLDG